MLPPDALERRVRGRLRALADDGLLRTLRPPAGVDLSSNDYLGLARHPTVTARMAAAVEADGAGSTGSRLLRGERDAFAAIERRFAAFKGTEASLYFSSGYLANLAVLTTFAEAGDLILSDALNHASLIDGIRLSGAPRAVVPHADVPALAARLAAHRGDGQVFVVTESLFSMDGDEAPLAALVDTCRAHGAHLIVDEAHAVGVRGRRGSGLLEETGTTEGTLLSINTGGKALGVSGAFVAGPAWAIQYLVQRARPFIFSTAPPPAVAAALDAALDVVEEEPGRRARLDAKARRMRARLTEAGARVPVGVSQVVPVLIGENDCAVAVAETLQGQGFDVRAIRPPTVPSGTARLRVSVNVGLSDDTIDAFAAAVGRALAAHGVSCASTGVDRRAGSRAGSHVESRVESRAEQTPEERDGC